MHGLVVLHPAREPLGRKGVGETSGPRAGLKWGMCEGGLLLRAVEGRA